MILHVVDELFAATGGRAQISPSQIGAPRVKFVTGDEKSGKVVWLAGDKIDLAMIQVNCPEGVAVAEWQETPDVRIGDQVFAVGNPSGLGWTTTFGKISAFRDHEFGTRKVPVVQTDARIGPGNSGGGLYAQNGALIGRNGTANHANRHSVASGDTVGMPSSRSPPRFGDARP